MLEHHQKAEYCETRPLYRASKKLTSVKVYSISSESQYLLIQNVPDIKVEDELRKLIQPYCKVLECKKLIDYPSEPFTTTYSVKLESFNHAKFIKKKFDDYSFYGSILHICYAPEYENVQETITKINNHLNDVINRTKDYEKYKNKE